MNSPLFYYGYLIFGIICLILSIGVTRSYVQKQNKLSLYLIGFFILEAISRIIFFILSPIVLNTMSSILTPIVYILGICSLCSLFLFVSNVLEFQQIINYIVIIFTAIIDFMLFFFPELNNLSFMLYGSTVAVASVILFFVIYKKNKDGKSLGFALSLIFISLAEPTGAIPEISFFSGIFFIISSIFLVLGFIGVFDKRKSD